jgi:homoserine dehydrogenase
MRVAILGHGVIGGGVSRILTLDQDSFFQKTGRKIELSAICTIDPKEDSEMYRKYPHLFRDASEVFSDSNIEIVCETIGGDGIAFELVKKAIRSGKHVVTANKKMIARHFLELHSLANEHNVSLFYEAAVGGGIPLLSTICNGLSGDLITNMEGVINGTTNFILTEMEKTGNDFSEILQDTQKKGFAEADPTDDIEGFDASYKLSILMSLAFHTYIPAEDIPTKGISCVKSVDFQYAHVLGKTIKLVASAKKTKEGIFAEVCPALFSQQSRIAKVGGVLNGLNLKGKYNTIGNFLSGEGAGRFPTAAAIVSDILSLAKGEKNNIPSFSEGTLISPPESSWYLRFSVQDKPGIVGDIGTILGKYGISLDTVYQFDPHKNPAHFMVTTFPVAQNIFQNAYKELKNLDYNEEPPFIMPIRG